MTTDNQLHPSLDTPLTVIMDLDETLVNSAGHPRDDWPDDILFELDDGDQYWTTLRPGAQWLMKKLLDDPDRYTVGVYTAATRDYAEAIIDLLVGKERAKELAFLLDETRTKFDLDKRLTAGWGDQREARMIKHKSLKKAQRLAKAPRSRIIAVDDRADVWQSSYSNHLSLPAFEKPERNDKIAQGIYRSLHFLSGLDEVREIEKRGMVFRKANEYARQRLATESFGP